MSRESICCISLETWISEVNQVSDTETAAEKAARMKSDLKAMLPGIARAIKAANKQAKLTKEENTESEKKNFYKLDI